MLEKQIGKLAVYVSTVTELFALKTAWSHCFEGKKCITLEKDDLLLQRTLVCGSYLWGLHGLPSIVMSLYSHYSKALTRASWDLVQGRGTIPRDTQDRSKSFCI